MRHGGKPGPGIERRREGQADRLEARRLHDELQRLGVIWPHVGEVEIEGMGEHRDTLGIRRLEDRHAARRELASHEVHEGDDTRWRKVLDELRAEDTVERAVGLLLEKGEGIAMDDVEALRAAMRDVVEIEVHAAPPRAVLSQQLEKLPAAATDVHDQPAGGDVLEVRRLPGPDLGL